MNNLAPDKWIVFIQWAVALQWIRLVTGIFNAPHTETVAGLGAVGGSPSMAGYADFLQENVLNNPELFSALVRYGGAVIGVVLLLSGIWVLVHRPIGMKTVTGIILVLLGGFLLNLTLYIALELRHPAFHDINILMAVLQLILVLYYLQLRRLKKRNHGTNLQY